LKSDFGIDIAVFVWLSITGVIPIVKKKEWSFPNFEFGRIPEHVGNCDVRLLTITDKQFERMKVFHGKIRKATKKAPEQLSFF